MTIRVRLSALLIASTLTLVGCGGSDSGSDEGVADLSANKILAAANKQLAEEDFITIKGNGTDEKAGTKLEVDLGFAGDTASGKVTVNGMDLELLKADGKAYFKADKEFFVSSGAPAETMDLIGGRWVAVDPANASFGEIASFVSKQEFFDELLDPSSKITKGKEKTVNGVECVVLKDDEGTFYFDKSDGKPISLVTTDDGTGTLDFSYDKIDEAEAPPAGEVVDLSKLGS